jgi:hypothetical protein
MSDFDDDYKDYGDDGDDSGIATGTYENEDLQFPIDLSGDDLLIVKDGNTVLAKLPVKAYRELLVKKLGRELSAEELKQELSKYTATIHAKAACQIDIETDSNYGADADGNRGVSKDFYGDNLEVEPEQLDLRLIDEDGNVLGGEDFCIDLEDCDGLVQYIESEVESDLDRYFS